MKSGAEGKAVVYEIKNLGRSKWCGEVRAQSDHPEHVEAALMKAAERHLRSRNIDFNGDIDSGTIHAGFHTVGEYKRKKAPSA